MGARGTFGREIPLGFLAAAILLTVSLAAYRPAPAQAEDAVAPVAPLPVVATTVHRVSGYDVRGRYVGRVVGRRTSDLGFDTSGLLDAVLVREGDRVRKGEVLARLNATRLEANRQRLIAEEALARATYKETEAKLALAKITAERQKNLLRSDNVSRQAYDEARFEEQALRAMLDANGAAIKQAQAAVAAADADISLAQIVAPFDGIVVDRMVDEGVALGSATPVLRLLEDSVMEVRIGVPPAIAGELETEATYDIEIFGKAYRGRLRAVLEALDLATRTVPALFVIEGRLDGTRLRSGELAILDVTKFVADEGYWLPLGALVGGRRGLWDALALVRTEDEPALYRTVRRNVEVLQTETDRVFVRGAIADGDLIVADGVHRIVPGQIVRLAQPQP
ncbi:efflux RND transporter periplasmic adaptor subunit [Thalassobaculum sp. OXR-137]|uniref:efflux RND transporter periplasmic adaptor subunit n=1 Tax=Thalassobaculum sp. OXR-137 TaxID=3100173 RepID=UPI002AC9DF5E|nr:efflux RND transporter periplasmic adaptor subunit [Thalassobaculum sp. OXR-137]WPZ35792.1 efflux RND transporter periplasmic adaptor subunit [Thalassobaculum sp. OXR-137]